MPKPTYAEKLKDPRWQKRRLELLQAADWTCKECRSKSDTLHVHHGYYKRNTEPWDYPDEVMHVLCEPCHDRAELVRGIVYEQLATLDLSDWEKVKTILDFDNAEIGARSSVLRVFERCVLLGATSGIWPDGYDEQRVLEWISKMALIAQHDSGFHRGFEAATREKTA